MIKSVGVDVVPHRKVVNLWLRHGPRAREVVFTHNELREMIPNTSLPRDASLGESRAEAEGQRLTEAHVEYLASRFAAKEATIKVLGLGLDIPFELNDIEVLGRSTLTVRLSGALADHARALGISTITGSACAAAGYTVSCIIGEDRDEQSPR